MRVLIAACVAIAGALAACGVEHLRPASRADVSASPTVIDFARQRYTSFRASMGMAQWGQSTARNREKAVFRIASNEMGWRDDYAAFIADMQGYCSAKGGQWDTFDVAISRRQQELIKKYTRVTEANAYGGSAGTAAFECGPPGRGSIETNWSQFNPQQCRKLYTTALDYQAVQRELGNPADFGCVVPGGAGFIGQAHDSHEGGNVVSVRIRLNQGVNGQPIPYAGYPQVE